MTASLIRRPGRMRRTVISLLLPTRSQAHAAVDDIGRPGDERRLVRGQIDRELGHLLRLPEPQHGLMRLELLARLRGIGQRGQPLTSEGVSTVPGQIALQRMPLPTKSIATALVSPITPVFVAA